MTIAEQVRDRLEGMSPSERSVARALFASYPSAGLESLPQLAEAASVTGPTVLRFVRKIGFDGYPAFQRALRDEVQARMEGMLALYESRGATLADHSLQQRTQSLRRGLDETLDAASLAAELPRVVRLLTDVKRHAWFAGGRFSRLVAEYLFLLLRMMRPGCSLVGQAASDRALDGLEIAKNDVVCVFDYRRYQSDSVAVGKLAAERGATVVVVTDPWLSPAVEYARHVLISCPEATSPIDSMLGGFAVAELIAAEVLSRLGSAGRARLEDVESTQERMLQPEALQGQADGAKGGDGSAI